MNEDNSLTANVLVEVAILLLVGWPEVKRVVHSRREAAAPSRLECLLSIRLRLGRSFDVWRTVSDTKGRGGGTLQVRFSLDGSFGKTICQCAERWISLLKEKIEQSLSFSGIRNTDVAEQPVVVGTFES